MQWPLQNHDWMLAELGLEVVGERPCSNKWHRCVHHGGPVGSHLQCAATAACLHAHRMAEPIRHLGSTFLPSETPVAMAMHARRPPNNTLCWLICVIYIMAVLVLHRALMTGLAAPTDVSTTLVSRCAGGAHQKCTRSAWPPHVLLR